MRNRTYFALLAFPLLCASSASAAPPVRLIIMAGQSNMVGYGNGYELPAALSEQTDIWYDHHNPDAREGWGYENATSTDWEPLAPMGSDYRYGPELTFGRAVADALPGQQIAIVKMSQKGTNIHEHWARGVPPYTDEGPELLYKSQLYHLLMGSLDSAVYDEAHGNALAYPLEVTRVDHALQRLQDAGVEFTVAGVIWMQGENEAGGQSAFQYSARLQSFVLALREDLGVAPLPFVIGRVSDNLYAANGGPIPEERTPNIDAVRAAQMQFAESYPWGAWVDTDDLEPRAADDAYHFTSESYQILGQRFADAYLEVIAREVDGDAGAWPGTDAGVLPDAGESEVDAAVPPDASEQDGSAATTDAGADGGLTEAGGEEVTALGTDAGDDGGCSVASKRAATGTAFWQVVALGAMGWLLRRRSWRRPQG